MPLFIKTCHTFLLKANILFYMIFSKRFAHLTISSKKIWRNTCMTQTRNMYWKYVASIPWFINYLYCWIYSSYVLHKKSNKILQEPDWPFVSFWNLKSPYFICFHSFSFVVPLPHSLSLIVICYNLLSVVVFYCHSLSLDLLLVVTRWPSLSFVLPLVVILCHLMYHSSVFL